MTLEKFNEIRNKEKYYAGRWAYFSEVVNYLKDKNFDSIIELGPHKYPIVENCDTLDYDTLYNPTYLHDASSIPWPINTRKYDLFIALQVWEHLKNKQQAFIEVLRITKKTAILSFPYKWTTSSIEHRNIDEQKIAEWTCNVVPKKMLICGSGGKRKIIYFFEFEK